MANARWAALAAVSGLFIVVGAANGCVLGTSGDDAGTLFTGAGGATSGQSGSPSASSNTTPSATASGSPAASGAGTSSGGAAGTSGTNAGATTTSSSSMSGTSSASASPASATTTASSAQSSSGSSTTASSSSGVIACSVGDTNTNCCAGMPCSDHCCVERSDPFGSSCDPTSCDLQHTEIDCDDSSECATGNVCGISFGLDGDGNPYIVAGPTCVLKVICDNDQGCFEVCALVGGSCKASGTTCQVAPQLDDGFHGGCF